MAIGKRKKRCNAKGVWLCISKCNFVPISRVFSFSHALWILNKVNLNLFPYNHELLCIIGHDMLESKTA